MVGVEDRADQRPAVVVRGTEGVFDEFGAHVVGDLPARELPGAEIDAGREVEVRAVGDRQVGDVAHVAAAGVADGEVPSDQVGEAPGGLVRDRGLHPSSQPDPRETVLTHYPRDALVIHPLRHGHTVVEVGGDPGRPVGAVATLSGVLQHPDPRRQHRVVCRLRGSPPGGVQPGVERRAGDLDDLTQPLHAVGVLVILNKLEAVHQFVSPAKYFAA